jgi:hypothetical protein
MTYICPVCGFDGLEEPAVRYNICDCCGTEFGNDDKEFSHAQLRSAWLHGGAHWFSTYSPPPVFWSPLQQLSNVGYRPTEQELEVLISHGVVGVRTVVDIVIAVAEVVSPFPFPASIMISKFARPVAYAIAEKVAIHRTMVTTHTNKIDEKFPVSEKLQLCPSF